MSSSAEVMGWKKSVNAQTAALCLKKGRWNALHAARVSSMKTRYFDMSKIYHHSMSDGHKSDILANDSIFSSMLKNH